MKELKSINIKQFLSANGIEPRQERAGYGMYLSPLRDEHTPSFKVDYNQNLWHDFGNGEGGSIIDLVMRLENCSYVEAVKRLENFDSFSFHREESVNSINTVRPPHCSQSENSIHSANLAHCTQSALQIYLVKPLQDIRLIDYLQRERFINITIAKEYCREVHYTINGKPFFAVGFQCDAGGWELRNEYFKGSTSPKSPTTINVGSPYCLLFEGFMDMLSYLTLKQITLPKIGVVVLNSVNNLHRAEEFLKQHKTIYCFFDNDEAGKQALAKVEKLGIDIIDHSSFYNKHKDLNEYLRSRRTGNTQSQKRENNLPNNQIPKSDEEPKPRRGFRF